ncbi:MAG TPA: tryptophan synthase subunit alpha [Tepidisphaeraceae bacterium]|nr:tryptophan synthase subunit alpha [Tepidisphaeraceae bacterium]
MARLTISNVFDSHKKQRQIALMPFVPAGYPDLQTTAATIESLAAAGAGIIEIGIPFSDPIADGPIIQEAFTETLKHKLHVNDVFSMVASVRTKVNIPLAAMVSYSVVFRYGLARFLTNAKMSGFDGLILPDLPPPEAQKICEQIRSAGLDTILFIAPTTAPQRRAEIVALCSGFVYYLSISGITGERQQLPSDLRDNVKEIKQLTDRPVCVGFGIHKAEHVKQLADFADGAIVGSAMVRRMKEHLTQGSTSIASAAGVYCKELLSLVR